MIMLYVARLGANWKKRSDEDMSHKDLLSETEAAKEDSKVEKFMSVCDIVTNAIIPEMHIRQVEVMPTIIHRGGRASGL